ncbi:GNAT family N-acetyltransferase [Clostridium sp. 19966]|uniref:GNAT family N-acetyltransferase n=1 Tax=Clostridium sp. 19966 TaxID=2768166 RepID=UPI0028DE1DC4|nr:GNAT family N-acetyltransferase [Clostridium sp. 19966]MDT8718691.1 GNAT family N-acetyltransferase [Clostridium sp. 19966]
MEWVLETERLLLREITEEDFDFILELEARTESYKYEMGGRPEKDKVIESCKNYIEAVKKLPEEGAIKFIVCNKKGEKMGAVSVWCNWEKTKEWEIGYKFLKEYWVNGYASEAAAKVVDFTFTELSIHKLMAFINYENKNSAALAKRVGMVQEGHMREARLIEGKWNDELVFTLLKTDLK